MTQIEAGEHRAVTWGTSSGRVARISSATWATRATTRDKSERGLDSSARYRLWTGSGLALV